MVLLKKQEELMKIGSLSIDVGKDDAIDSVLSLTRAYLECIRSAMGAGDKIQIVITQEHDSSVPLRNSDVLVGSATYTPTEPHLAESSQLLINLFRESGKSSWREIAETLKLPAGTLSSVKIGKLAMPDRVLTRLHTAFGVPEDDLRVVRLIEIVRANRKRRK